MGVGALPPLPSKPFPFGAAAEVLSYTKEWPQDIHLLPLKTIYRYLQVAKPASDVYVCWVSPCLCGSCKENSTGPLLQVGAAAQGVKTAAGGLPLAALTKAAPVKVPWEIRTPMAMMRER